MSNSFNDDEGREHHEHLSVKIKKKNNYANKLTLMPVEKANTDVSLLKKANTDVSLLKKANTDVSLLKKLTLMLAC